MTSSSPCWWCSPDVKYDFLCNTIAPGLLQAFLFFSFFSFFFLFSPQCVLAHFVQSTGKKLGVKPSKSTWAVRGEACLYLAAKPPQFPIRRFPPCWRCRFRGPGAPPPWHKCPLGWGGCPSPAGILNKMFLPTAIAHASHTGRIVLTETPLSAALRATHGAFVQDNLAIRAADKSLGNPDFVHFSGGWEDGSLQPWGLPSSPGCWQKMSWRGFPQHRVIVTCSALPYAQGCCSLPCSKYFSFSQG